MNLLDVVILVAAFAYGISGLRSGALVGVFSLVGFLGGALIGAQIARPVGSAVADGRAQVPVAILCVLLCATVGQVIMVAIGVRLRDRFVRGWARPWDAGVGALLGIVSVLLVAWMVAVPLASSPYPTLAAEAGQSRVVRAVNDRMPEDVRQVYGSLRTFLDRSGFPPVLGDLPSTSIVPVPAPSALTPAQAETVARASRSVFKIYGQAPECDRGIEGSGFVYAPHRLLTNAHVVAGTRRVVVQSHDGAGLPATVIVYDPERDLAVLDVPELSAPALPFRTGDAARGEAASVLGYPQDGPFTVRTARVRGKEVLLGRDIYDARDVTRTIYSVRAVVRSGNSGGPLVDSAGRVLGVVFATSLSSSDTGFVLADEEIRAVATAGRSATAGASTQGCTPE